MCFQPNFSCSGLSRKLNKACNKTFLAEPMYFAELFYQQFTNTLKGFNASTWCHHILGKYKASPASSSAICPCFIASANFGYCAKSGLLKSTMLNTCPPGVGVNGPG